MAIDKEQFNKEYEELNERIGEILNSGPDYDKDLALALMLEKEVLKLSAFELKCTDLLLTPEYLELKTVLIFAAEHLRELSAENEPYTGDNDLVN